LLIKFIFAVIFTEAVTEIAVKSELFSPIREFFFNRRGSRLFEFIHSVLDCGYCFSVWVAFFTGILILIESDFVYFCMACVVVHRLSNAVHFMMDRLNGER